jgi:chemotaxis protein CheD
MSLVVGVAEMKVSSQPAEVLITYSLGSCIGLTLFDPHARVGGLIHCMLPSSSIDPDKARSRPEMFTDTGVVALLVKLLDLGAEKKNLVAKAAGAAKLLDASGIFRIGERNHAVLKKVLEKNGIRLLAEDVGGTSPRTLSLRMETGETFIKCRGREERL